MNVHPQLTQHPKFTLFKRNLGDPQALEYLIRLWGHCQVMSRGENWGKVSADYVEAVCLWSGNPGKLFMALSTDYCGKPGWIKVSRTGEVIITSWEEHNKGIVTNWGRGSYGKLGGRPKRNPTETPAKPRGVSDANPTETPRKPLFDMSRYEVSGGTEGAHTGLKSEGKIAKETPFPEVEIPGLAEVLEFARGSAGIPEKTARAFFEHYQKTAHPAWTDAAGKRFQWRGKLTSWAVRDRESGKASARPPEDKTLSQLEAELDAATTPEERERIRQQIKKWRGVHP